MSELAELFRAVADGTPPPADDGLTVLTPPDERSVGVLAFTGHNVVSADVAPDWVRSCLPAGRVEVPLSPPFLAVLAAVTGRVLDGVDLTLVAPANGRRRGVELTELTDSDHPRIAYARQRRTDVRAFSCDGGLLVLGRGVAGRWEAAVEVDPVVRGFGLGRGLFSAALGLVPPGEPVWVQIAPANAASLRSALAAGYRPAGAEALLLPVSVGPPSGWDGDAEPMDWFLAQTPAAPLPDPSAPLLDPAADPEPEPISETPAVTDTGADTGTDDVAEVSDDDPGEASDVVHVGDAVVAPDPGHTDDTELSVPILDSNPDRVDYT